MIRYIVADVGFQNTQKPYEGVWQACNMKSWRQNSNLGSDNINVKCNSKVKSCLVICYMYV